MNYKKVNLPALSPFDAQLANKITSAFGGMISRASFPQTWNNICNYSGSKYQWVLLFDEGTLVSIACYVQHKSYSHLLILEQDALFDDTYRYKVYLLHVLQNKYRFAFEESTKEKNSNEQESLKEAGKILTYAELGSADAEFLEKNGFTITNEWTALSGKRKYNYVWKVESSSSSK